MLNLAKYPIKIDSKNGKIEESAKVSVQKVGHYRGKNLDFHAVSKISKGWDSFGEGIRHACRKFRDFEKSKSCDINTYWPMWRELDVRHLRAFESAAVRDQPAREGGA